jgi:hypothetical protein
VVRDEPQRRLQQGRPTRTNYRALPYLVVAAMCLVAACSGGGGAVVTRGGLGEPVGVGNLDLTVHGVTKEFDSKTHDPANNANVAVEVTAVNARGEAGRPYNLRTFLTMALIDAAGNVHSPERACTRCPQELASVDLAPGESVRGFVYFAIPAEHALTELRYQAYLSTRRGEIRLTP